MSTAAIFVVVLLPFVTGYFLSYYFRTVNAVLSTHLMRELGLDAAQLGLMTSAYFLMAALAQLPLGWALDRFGPKRVQATCILLTAAGALLFAHAHDVLTLFIGRALVGLGVASALLAGLKALAMVCPPARLGLFNGLYMSIGCLGAVASSLPTEALLASISWRQLFVGLAVASLASAVLIALIAPGISRDEAATGPTSMAPRYADIFSSQAYWRLVPLSATTLGGAWALQGLWSGPWLRDVASLEQPDVATLLFVMAFASSVGALGFGALTSWLGKLGVAPAQILTVGVLCYLLAQLGLALDWPVPPLLLWCVVAAFSAGTVIVFTMSAQRFPKESVGRANSALNLFHFAAAFAVQALVGRIVALWPPDVMGRYPAEAYQTAFLSLIVIQVLALLWFLRPEPGHATASEAIPVQARGAGGWRTATAVATAALLLAVLGYLALPSIRPALIRGVQDRPAVLAGTRLAEVDARLDRQQARLSGVEREISGIAAKVDVGRAEATTIGSRVAAIEGLLFQNQTQAALAMARVDALSARLDARDAAVAAAAVVPAVAIAPAPVAVLPTSAKCEPAAMNATAPDLLFGRNQADLTPAQRRAIDAFAEQIKGCFDLRLSIRGFTDSGGSTKRNLRLSRTRAGLVANRLLRAGIPASHIDAVGHGADNPVGDDATTTGRDRNRRVEIRLARASRADVFGGSRPDR